MEKKQLYNNGVAFAPNNEISLDDIGLSCFYGIEQQTKVDKSANSSSQIIFNVDGRNVNIADGDVIRIEAYAKFKNQVASATPYSQTLSLRNATTSLGIKQRVDGVTNTISGEWTKVVSKDITVGSGISQYVKYIILGFNFYNKLTNDNDIIRYKDIYLFINGNKIEFDTNKGDSVVGSISQEMDVQGDGVPKSLLATQDYVKQMTSASSNYYQGKKWVAFGDSITDGTTTYCNWVAQDFGMTLTNQGVSGYKSASVLTKVNTFLSENGFADYDVISVFCGVNDFLFNVPIDTLKSNLRSIFNTILSNSTAKVYIAATPIRQGSKETNTLGLGLADYVNAYIEIAKECGWQLLDQYFNGVTHFDLTNWQNSGMISTDKLHPNESGHKLIAQQWKSFMSSIR